MSFDAPNVEIKKWQYPGMCVGILAAAIAIFIMAIAAVLYQIVTSFCNKFGVTTGFYQTLTMYQKEWENFINKYDE